MARVRRIAGIVGIAVALLGVGFVLAPDEGEAGSGVTANDEPSISVPSASPSDDVAEEEAATNGTLDADVGSGEAESADAGSGVTAGRAQPPTAADLLEELEVKGRAPKTGYDRDLFGQRWADTDHNGCDTRNDILSRDLNNREYKPGTRDCVVVSGTLSDPFTGTQIDFVRGEGTSNAVQIDHVVALSDAWQKGAEQLDEEQRTLFANDPLNLLAVDGPSNASKGDGDAATWLPPNKAFRCDYVARQVAVKHRYELWVTQAEYDAIDGILDGCPGQPVPNGLTTPLIEGPAEPSGFASRR